MMLHHQIIITFMVVIFVSSSIEAGVCNRTCGNGKGNLIHVPYPFGFSEGCQIPINCTGDGEIAIGQFRVQNITADSVLINLPAKCNRTIAETQWLFGRNYALTWQNELMLKNCSTPIAGCMLSTTMVEARLSNCGMGSDNLSCYSETESGSGFMTYKNLTRTRCGFLFTSIAADVGGSPEVYSTVSQRFEAAELGWWLNGPCNCSEDANCTTMAVPSGGKGFRCLCEEGFVGDGFAGGSGCRRGVPFSTSNPRAISRLAILGVPFSTSNPRAISRLAIPDVHFSTPNPRAILRLAIPVLVVVGLLIFIVTICCLKRRTSLLEKVAFWKKKRLNDNHNVELVIRHYESLAPKRYRHADISKMTNSFKDKLGQGGYGAVYKGMLSDGRIVAVKVLSETKGNGEEFINEVASISTTSHVNVVSLLGFCYERNKRALVYEFMAKGSLDKFIWVNDDESSSTTNCHLELRTLYEIAIGIARGLEYLHRGCSTQIVHFDIKPHNILLDEDFCPKISDFGLAKLGKRKESKMSMVGARGTVGYIAPEVFSRTFGKVSHKSDVYSYGMLVLEVTGARDKVEVAQTSEIYFPHWIYEHLEQGNDLRLRGVNTIEEEETARKMILVGLWCIQTFPKDRPPMSKVVEMLEGSLQSLQIPPMPFLSSPARPILSASDSYDSSSTINKVMEV